MNVTEQDVEIAIVGAGIIGIATAYYLVAHGKRRIAIIDSRLPMSLTSAQSGENYRNWWPHAVMREFTDRSIDLMEQIARDTDNRLHMTRRGYVLATRRARPSDMIDELYSCYGEAASTLVRLHDRPDSANYQPPLSAAWESAPSGVDVLLDPTLIQRTFPSFSHDIATVIHVRRAGDISGQQLGQIMLERIRAAGGRLVPGRLRGIETGPHFGLRLEREGGLVQLRADIVVNAAGPTVNEVAAMLGESLPVTNVLQQKIAFEDREGAISRQMPFSIDLDGQTIDWTDEEREALAADPSFAALAKPMPGGIHCRPDGGEAGRWIKLGWAYNRTPSDPVDEPRFDRHFPEVVLRGASRLNPSLKTYYGRLPRACSHYGGYYTMTPENWPLIGPMRRDGAYLAGALSGFGTMAACAAGDLCARWIVGAALPSYGRSLGLARYSDKALIAGLTTLESKGVL